MNDPNASALAKRLFKPDFPRSSNYDPQWLIDTVMGPHPLWLAEWLSQRLPLSPGMRVLDLGCGRATSSIFLAKEFGVTVWAADHWINPQENFARIEQAGSSASVFPISVEAHALPFAARSFDAIVSFDAYHYFGTDDVYLGYIATFLKPGGWLGIVVPGTLEELAELPPPHLAPYWVWEFCSFHSAGWWARHWQKTRLLEVDTADTLTEGWKLWLEWNEVCAQFGQQDKADAAYREAEMLRVDNGQTFGFVRLIAQLRNV